MTLSRHTLLWRSSCTHSPFKGVELVTPGLLVFNLLPTCTSVFFRLLSGFGPLLVFRCFLNWPTYIRCPLCSLCRSSAARRPPAGHLQAELTAPPLTAHISASLLLDRDSLKCTGNVVEDEQQLNPLAAPPLFPASVSAVRPMDPFGARKGSVGSRSSPVRDVSTAKAAVEKVAMEHSKADVTVRVATTAL